MPGRKSRDPIPVWGRLVRGTMYLTEHLVMSFPRASVHRGNEPIDFTVHCAFYIVRVVR